MSTPTYAHPKSPPKGHVICRTVGEVIAALQSFHPDTPTRSGLDDAVAVTLYNVGLDDEHVEFEDADGLDVVDDEDGDDE